MSFRLLFRSLHFIALVFATISLVCFGVQEKEVGKNSCFGVPLHVLWFSNARCERANVNLKELYFQLLLRYIHYFF